MDDFELRARLDALREQVDELHERTEEVRRVVTSIQLADAESRGDLKVVVGKLDNAANALATAAQSIQKVELRAGGTEDGRLPTWAVRAGFILLAIVAALVGVKELLPTILKLMAGGM